MKKAGLLILMWFIAVQSYAQTASDLAFVQKEVTLKTSTGELFGVLTISNHTQKTPLVIIVAGSGPTDRDGNNPLGVNASSYKMLAEDLARFGISALRYDKRGIAKSAGAMVMESELRFDHYIEDVMAWVEMMRSEPQFTQIIVAGHSEGSLLGMVASRRAGADGFISIAGPGRPIDQILEEQLQKAPENLKEEINKVMKSLKSGETVENVSMALFSLFRPSVQPYLINWMQYDPTVEIARLNIPVLIIHGSTDLQVPQTDAKLLAEAKPEAQIAIFETMNHVLKESTTYPEENIASYRDATLPLAKGLVEVIAEFIKRNN